MAKIESANYLSALKGKKLADIQISSSRSDVLRKQENRCIKCKKELKAGYFTSKINPQTKEAEIICSNCLVQISRR